MVLTLIVHIPSTIYHAPHTTYYHNYMYIYIYIYILMYRYIYIIVYTDFDVSEIASPATRDWFGLTCCLRQH